VARLADVAKAAGVATSTASRVLSDAPEAVHISDKTKKLVRDAAHQLRYRANPAARSLRTRKTHTIGLLGHDLHPAHMGSIVRGAGEVLLREGFHLLISSMSLASGEQAYGLDYFRHRVDGILIAYATWNRERGGVRNGVRERHVPMVVFEGNSEVADIPSVSVDYVAAGRTAVRHLVEMGHRHIAYLGGSQKNASNRARQAGYRREVEERLPGVAPVIMDEKEDAPSCVTGYENAKAVLARHPEITAFFAFNDMVAIGAIRAVKELGRKVPEEISVVGFDDEAWSEYIDPALTTFRFPREEVGATAAKLLLERISSSKGKARKSGETRNEPAPTVVLEAELIVRKSTGPIAS